MSAVTPPSQSIPELAERIRQLEEDNEFLKTQNTNYLKSHSQMYQLSSQLAVRLQRLLFPAQKPEYIDVHELLELADKRTQSAQQGDDSALHEEIELKN